MLQTLKNAWRTPDIRRKLLYVAFILIIYRIGTVIPVPFVDASNFEANFGNTIFAYMDVLSGNALSQATLFALGISPYITASIIIQLLAVAFPALGEKMKDSKDLNEKLTRYITVVLAVITGYGYYALLKSYGMLSLPAGGKGIEVLAGIVIVACYCAGASVVMWLGEKINENGIGNGISIILFANIVSSIPSILIKLGQLIRTSFAGDIRIGAFSYSALRPAEGADKFWAIALAIGFALGVILVTLALTMFVIYITGSERRIPILYAKRVVGRKMYGGQNTHLPIKLNMTGVMPIIFASSIMSLLPTILTLCGVVQRDSYADCQTFWERAQLFFSADRWFYPVCLFVLIIAFAYFYVSISFNTTEVANNLKKNGGMIPGIRQGRPTSVFIDNVTRKVTLVGALFLGVIAILPIIMAPLVIRPIVTAILTRASGYSAEALTEGRVVSSFSQAFAFGGTSLLIVIGVAQETFREIEAQLTMRNYKGFL
ncbi:MAG: preprotein translocase subunit SecY [Clostridia bacterium]|nr:preprotein translocase subunit SecY [Clostridia bacterium]